MSINLAESLDLTTLEGEIWKDIVGYEGLYQISSFGRLKTLDRILTRGQFYIGRIIKQMTSKTGYKTNCLWKTGKTKGFQIHRLVALHFIENNNPEEYNIVDHIDENKANNHYSNLRWCTNRMNSQYYSAGRKDELMSEFTGVSWCERQNQWIARISFKGSNEHLGYFDKEEDARDAYIKASNMSRKELRWQKDINEIFRGLFHQKYNDRIYFICGFPFVKNFSTNALFTSISEAIKAKYHILENIENINLYRKKPYDFKTLKGKIKNTNINRLKQHKHYDSFKHLI